MSCFLSAGIGFVHTLMCMFHNSDHDPWSFKDIPLLPNMDFDAKRSWNSKAMLQCTNRWLQKLLSDGDWGYSRNFRKASPNVERLAGQPEKGQVTSGQVACTPKGGPFRAQGVTQINFA